MPAVTTTDAHWTTPPRPARTWAGSTAHRGHRPCIQPRHRSRGRAQGRDTCRRSRNRSHRLIHDARRRAPSMMTVPDTAARSSPPAATEKGRRSAATSLQAQLYADMARYASSVSTFGADVRSDPFGQVEDRRLCNAATILVVDGNNVIGAVADGWRDRPAAVRRLLGRMQCLGEPAVLVLDVANLTCSRRRRRDHGALRNSAGPRRRRRPDS